jgi:hypothetical protein
MPPNDDVTAESHLALEERIRKRAHEIWQSRKRHGAEDTALKDWLEAEREVLGRDAHSSAQNRGATVGSAYKPDAAETKVE